MKVSSAVRAVFALEILSLFRDPRTVLISVVLPLLLIPGLLLAGSWVEDRRAEREDSRTYRLAVTGSGSAFASDLLEGAWTAGDRASEAGRFRRVDVEDPESALEAGSLDLHLEVLEPEEWRALVERGEADGDRIPTEFDGTPVFRIHFHSTRTASREGANALRDSLFEIREGRRDRALVEAGFPVPREQVAVVETVNVASEREVQGAQLGRYLTLLLVGMMILGGSAVSVDTLAGEKERGTLVTLLTAAAPRSELIAGKLLAVMAVALGIALVQVLNLWIFLGLGLIEGASGFAVAVSPSLAAGLLLLYLPVVALTAGVLLLSSAYANSYKEAQLYLTPVLLGMLLPALVPLLPEISLRSAIVAVPIANLSVAARDLLVGQIYVPGLVASWVVTAGAAAWVTARSVRALEDEGVITGDTSRAEFRGGPELFPKRVLRWFLVFWAVKVLFDFNVTFDDIRVAALVSVGLVFVAFPLLVIRHFRLNPVEALALRMPRPGIWLAVLLGAPAGLVLTHTVFQLMDLVLPVPSRLIEDFGQALMPEGVAAWQLILLLSIVPGISEELTFRGVLLHGLRTRFGPVALALVVGLVFGLFHFQLFRIPATATLGVILTAITLISGSIFPAMAWHALHNAVAVYLGTQGVELGLESWWWGVGSLIVLALAFRIAWGSRRPLPEPGAGAPGRGRREVGRGRHDVEER